MELEKTEEALAVVKAVVTVPETVIVPVSTFLKVLKKEEIWVKAAVHAPNDDVRANAFDGLRDALRSAELPEELKSDLERFGTPVTVTTTGHEDVACRTLPEVYEACRYFWTDAVPFETKSVEASRDEDVIEAALRTGLLPSMALVIQKASSGGLTRGRLYTMNPTNLKAHEWFVEVGDDVYTVDVVNDLVIREDLASDDRLLSRQAVMTICSLGDDITTALENNDESPLCVEFAVPRNKRKNLQKAAVIVTKLRTMDVGKIRQQLTGQATDRQNHEENDDDCKWGAHDAPMKYIWRRSLKSSRLTPLEETAMVSANEAMRESFARYDLRVTDEDQLYHCVHGVLYERDDAPTVAKKSSTFLKEALADAEMWRTTESRRQREKTVAAANVDLGALTDTELLEHISKLIDEARDFEGLKRRYELSWVLPLGRCIDMFLTTATEKGKDAKGMATTLLLVAAAVEERREVWGVSVERRLHAALSLSFDPSPQREALRKTFETLTTARNDEKRKRPSLGEKVMKTTEDIFDDVVAAERLRALESLEGDAGRAVRDFIDATGPLLTGDTLASPTFDERPAMLLRVLRSCVLKDEPRETGDSELVARYDLPSQPKLRDALRQARRGYRVRAETVQSPVWGLLRKTLLEAGKRFQIFDEDAVWFRQDDLQVLLSGGESREDATQRRKAAMKMSVSDDAPPLLNTPEGPRRGRRRRKRTNVVDRALVLAQEHLNNGGGRPENKTARTLRGLVGWRGARRGKVRLILKAGDLEFLASTEVAVLRSESLAPTASKLAAALICDTGTPFSLAALCARRADIPTLLSVAGASTILKNGDLVYVGSEVTRLDVPAPTTNRDKFFPQWDHPIDQYIAKVHDVLLLDLGSAKKTQPQLLVHGVDPDSTGFIVTLPPKAKNGLGNIRIPLFLSPPKPTDSALWNFDDDDVTVNDDGGDLPSSPVIVGDDDLLGLPMEAPVPMYPPPEESSPLALDDDIID